MWSWGKVRHDDSVQRAEADLGWWYFRPGKHIRELVDYFDKLIDHENRRWSKPGPELFRCEVADFRLDLPKLMDRFCG